MYNRLTENRIAMLIVSMSLLLVWDIFTELGIIGGKAQTILVILSLFPFVYASVKLLNDYKFESSYFKIIFIIFIFYEVIIVLRGWSMSYEDLKTFMQDEITFWPFIIPLFIFFDKKIISYGLLFKWIYFIGIFFLVIIVIFPSLILSRVTAETVLGFSLPCGFLLLNATYLSNRKSAIAFLVLFVSILSLTYLARRSGLASLLGFVVAGYFLNIFNKSKSKLFKFFPLLIIVGAFILFNQSFEPSRELVFNKMESRINEDTRSDLFDMFFKDMRDYMVFGKGMNASYYFPLWGGEMDGVVFQTVQYRRLIENGYLQLLLTGGIIHIVLFVLILLPAAIKGIFMSSNQFAKACGAVIILRLADMFLYGVPSLNLSYILVWICVGVCYKQSIRKMTSEEVISEFKKIAVL